MLAMQGLDLAEEEFEAKFHELMHTVRHHVNAEEHEMFPEAEQILEDQLVDLMDAMVELKHQLMTAPPQ